MYTYQKKSAFSAPSRNHLHHVYIKAMLHDYAHTPGEAPADSHLAYGTRTRSARGSENYAIFQSFTLSPEKVHFGWA